MKFEIKKSKQKNINKKKTIFMASIVLAVVILTGFVFVSTGLVSLTNQGYNYKAHSYKGTLCDYSPSKTNCGKFSDIRFDLKWNEAYMSSSPNELGEYERHKGFPTYFGSGATKVAHYAGKYYEEEFSKNCTWNAIQTYAAVPDNAVLDDTDLSIAIWRNEAGLGLGQKTSEEGMMRIRSINSDDCYDSLNGMDFLAEA